MKPLEFKPNIDEAAERMKRFWALEEPFERVPVKINLPKQKDGCDGLFFGKTEEYLQNAEAHFREQAKIFDERIPTVAPPYGHALIAGLCGSPIRCEAETVWSAPIIDDARRLNELHLDFDGAFGKKIRAEYEYLLERARGRYAVGEYEIEGVSDTMSALRGAEGTLADFYAEPDAAYAFASKVTDILIEFAEWNHANVGAPQTGILCGGMSTVWSVWMPEGSGATTEDCCVMVSAEFYKKFIMPHTSRLASALTKTLMEIHEEGRRHIAAMGATKGIDLLTGCNPLRMSEAQRNEMRPLLGKRAFMIGGVKPREVYELLQFTGTRGILLSFGAETADEGNEILKIVEKATKECMT